MPVQRAKQTNSKQTNTEQTKTIVIHVHESLPTSSLAKDASWLCVYKACWSHLIFLNLKCCQSLNGLCNAMDYRSNIEKQE